ncbi:MAG: hypothetical protein JWP80_3093 [Pseudomonas sp.]|nr:hypothetical protein [Pseudomonas sp.]
MSFLIHRKNASGINRPAPYQVLKDRKPSIAAQHFCEGQLHSCFALDQLTALARRSSSPEFVLRMASTFGFDVPVHTYLKLRDALLTHQLGNPKHQISTLGSYPADYDNNDRVIRIHPAVIQRVVEEPNASWELLAILLHEFGHHIDNLLRQDFADKNPDGSSTVPLDAFQEEGVRHAHHMALLDPLNLEDTKVQIATYVPLFAKPMAIHASYLSAMQRVRETQENAQRHPSDAEIDQENFEAGTGSDNRFTHETIDGALASLGFNRDEIDGVYFGNWLRDYSQLLDPKIVRATSMPKNFPDVLSRDALTEIVDVLAVRKFFQRRVIPSLFTVTPELLGVYRPSQHIDNPKVTNPQPADPTSRDADFEPWILPGDPLLQVDFDTSSKRYIQRSVESMQRELKIAAEEGRWFGGLRSFGSALHVLEDFFAHSNFVELSLIKQGHVGVLPWTSKADCLWGLPLVTGMFGASDVIASLAAPVGELVFAIDDMAFKPTKAGFRSDNDKIILILLREHQNPQHLETFEAFLQVRDAWANIPGSEYVEMLRWLTGAPARLLGNALSTVMQGMLKTLGNRVDDAQTRFDDPNTSGSTDPSHSQLSKDHAEHPLHRLAAILAKEAVIRTTQAMLDHWAGDPDADPLAVAKAFFVHPMDSTWQDAIVADWAKNNPDFVRRAGSKGEFQSLRQGINEAAQLAQKNLEKQSLEALKFIFSDNEGTSAFITLIWHSLIKR